MGLRHIPVLFGMMAIVGFMVGCSSDDATQAEATDREAGAFYNDIR